MEQTFEKLNDMLQKELDDIVKKGSMTPEHLAAVDKVVDIMKDIKEICEMGEEMGGYSQRYYNYDSYARGGRNMRGNSYGRYARGGGYSRHDEREEILDKLDHLMETSGTDAEREAIRQALRKLENM